VTTGSDIYTAHSIASMKIFASADSRDDDLLCALYFFFLVEEYDGRDGEVIID
jgi:hypothetical protein